MRVSLDITFFLDFVSDICFSPFNDCVLVTGSFDGDVSAFFPFNPNQRRFYGMSFWDICFKQTWY